MISPILCCLLLRKALLLFSALVSSLGHLASSLRSIGVYGDSSQCLKILGFSDLQKSRVVKSRKEVKLYAKDSGAAKSDKKDE